MNKAITIPAAPARPPLLATPTDLSRFARESQPTLLVYLRILLARKWLFLAVTLLIAIPAIAMIYRLTPIYRATATLLVEAAKSNVISIAEVYGGASANREYFQTQSEFLRSRGVALRVVREQKLTEHPFFDPRQRKPSQLQAYIAQLKAWAGLVPEEAEEPKPLSQTQLEEAVANVVQGGLDVALVRQSQLVHVSFESPDPNLAALIANGVANAYIRSDLDARLKMTQTATTWLSEQLEELRKKLQTSERQLQEYREAAGLVSTRGNTEGAGTTRQLEELAQRLVQARVTRSQIEQTYTQVRSGAPNRFQVPAVFNHQAVSRARDAELTAERKLAEIRDRLGPAHPLYVAAQSELDVARRTHRREAEAVIASIEREYEAAKAAERSLEAALAKARMAVQELNRKEIELDAYERDVATNRQLYQTFLARVRETSATSDFITPVARVVDEARAPLAPSKPNKRSLAMIALMFSLGCAGLLTMYVEHRQAVIRSSDEVETELHVPLLAAVPIVDKPPKGSSIARLQHEDPSSIFAESVRTAVTGVRLALMDVPCPVLAFTSTIPGEGKTTIATAFAIEQSRTKRVLLIDADLRRPRVASLIGLPKDSPGLAEVVAGAPAADCMHQYPGLNLRVMLGGNKPKNPIDLLLSPRFAPTIRELRQHFDLIVIDSPPIELVSDALLIGQEADGLVYVVKAATTPVKMIRRGMARLSTSGIQVLGVLLNAHDFVRASRYYGDTAAQAKYSYGA